MPNDAEWAGGSILVDEQMVETDADPASLFRTVSGIGGGRGWYVTPVLWEARGWIDKLIGGVGMRRGRRHPDDLWIGDAVDFWRVEAVEPDRLVRLRAEMRLPGEAWIEWRMSRPKRRRQRPGTAGHLRSQGALGPGVLVFAAAVPRSDLRTARLRLASAASTRSETSSGRRG